MEDLKSREHIVFNSHEEMFDYVCGDSELYNLETGDYVFKYNEVGSLAVYKLNLDEAEELEKESINCGEYWGGILGGDGLIYDDPSHELYREYLESNFDYCKRMFNVGTWIDVTY